MGDRWYLVHQSLDRCDYCTGTILRDLLEDLQPFLHGIVAVNIRRIKQNILRRIIIGLPVIKAIVFHDLTCPALLVCHDQPEPLRSG